MFAFNLILHNLSKQDSLTIAEAVLGVWVQGLALSQGVKQQAEHSLVIRNEADLRHAPLVITLIVRAAVLNYQPNIHNIRNGQNALGLWQLMVAHEGWSAEPTQVLLKMSKKVEKYLKNTCKLLRHFDQH